jgi:hypothetical protein
MKECLDLAEQLPARMNWGREAGTLTVMFDWISPK